MAEPRRLILNSHSKPLVSTYAELITNKFPRGTPRRGVPLGKCVNNFAQLLIFLNPRYLFCETIAPQAFHKRRFGFLRRTSIGRQKAKG